MSNDPTHSIAITGDGDLNGVTFNVTGQGRADATRGHIDFEVMFSPTPPRANAFGSLLSTLILPTVAFGREEDEASNILTLAPEGFSFVQRVAGEDVAAESAGTFQRLDRRTFAWDAHTNGMVRLPPVRAVDPFSAIMIPQGPGKVVETISMKLHTDDGTRTIAFFRTFTFSPRAELQNVQLRHMTLEPRVDASSVAVALTAAIVPFDAARRSWPGT